MGLAHPPAGQACNTPAPSPVIARDRRHNKVAIALSFPAPDSPRHINRGGSTILPPDWRTVAPEHVRQAAARAGRCAWGGPCRGPVPPAAGTPRARRSSTKHARQNPFIAATIGTGGSVRSSPPTQALQRNARHLRCGHSCRCGHCVRVLTQPDRPGCCFRLAHQQQRSARRWLRPKWPASPAGSATPPVPRARRPAPASWPGTAPTAASMPLRRG